ncbi:MAG: hypothetical protein QF439_02550 [Candidatus Marinimicrobia bacterium]|nr:hypothetical protein [Candidatus Neomarinimicrobiota bacterium]
MKAINYILLSSFFFFLTSCEEPEKKKEETVIELINTLDQSDLGGKTGYLSEYFYDFLTNYDIDFYRFTASYYTFDYEQYLNLFQDEPSVLSLHSFPEYLVEITPQETEFTERAQIDSLTTLGVIESGSLLISSTQFKNINTLVWDTDAEVDAQRYKPNNSDWIFDTTTVTYKDTLDVVAYRAVVDTPIIDQGVLFVDQNEWVDTTYEYIADERMEFNHTFNFERKQLNSDSLMFRINTDCNDNGSWDGAESEDTGNNIWDPAEPFYDLDDDDEKDTNEPYEDRNCNDVWDDAEVFTDANNNDTYDEGETFEDQGNGLIDAAEPYTDLDGDNQPDNNELFLFNPIPNRLLVNWVDQNTTEVLTTIQPGDSLTSRWGHTYTNIIEVVDFNDSKTVTAVNKDSLVTLYTNQVVAHIIEDGGSEDYFIVKTEWEDVNTDGNDYDYLLFKQNEHIYKLVKPSFFKPYGFYWSEGQIDAGFWFKNQFEDEVVYYSANGILREGENVETSYYDTTTVAIYRIERSFLVEVEDVTVPAKSIRGFINDDGNVECYANPVWPANNITDCPGADTTFVDAFKVTNTLTEIMIGTDVEYGEKNVTWLVKDYGIVKDELQIRWNEYPTSLSEQWVGLSRWELGRFSITSNGGSGLSNLLKRAHSVKLHDLQSIPELSDPFQIRRTAGLQRVEMPE